MSRLGFKSLHWEPERLADVVLGRNNNPSFEIYDDCDFICDIPHAYFLREIVQAYPGLKFILTERHEQEWYRSMCKHYPHQARKNEQEEELKKIVYGSSFDYNPEFLYKKRFRDWNDTIKRTIAKDDLLVMNICDTRDGYATLCPFVGKPVLNEPFPHENKSR